MKMILFLVLTLVTVPLLAYYPGDTRPNAIVCDRVVVVKLDFDQQSTNGKENRK